MPPVTLWPDTFNNYFHPEVAKAAVEVLEMAGFQVQTPQASLCCGRPLYDFGMLDTAKQWLQQILDALRPQIEADVPIVVLEPSCLAVFRDELVEILPHEKDANRLKANAFLLSEFLEKKAPNFSDPKLDRHALVWGHCHHRSVAGMEAEKTVLKKMGLDFRVASEATCCGMAGSFGFEHDHYAVAQQIGELGVLPQVRQADQGTIIIADGFSCQTQIQQGATGRQALHLAQVLKMAIDGASTGLPPDRLPETDYPKVRGVAAPAANGLLAAALLELAPGCSASWRCKRGWTMASQLRAKESGTESALRILRKEMRKTVNELQAGDDKSLSSEAVHNARKRLKKARAALRLVRDALGPRHYRCENAVLRDAARPLTEVRDAKVLAATAGKLADAGNGAVDAGAWDQLERRLDERQAEVRRRLLEGKDSVAPARQSLQDALGRLKQLALGKQGWSVLGQGLKRVYRAGRRAFAAAKDNPSTENLHEWRKQTKYLWHQVQMLEPVWPAALESLADQFHHLADQLGDDHDLAVLREKVQQPSLVDRHAADAIVKLIDGRRGELQKQASSSLKAVCGIAETIRKPPSRRVATCGTRRAETFPRRK